MIFRKRNPCDFVQKKIFIYLFLSILNYWDLRVGSLFIIILVTKNKNELTKIL